MESGLDFRQELHKMRGLQVVQFFKLYVVMILGDGTTLHPSLKV